MMMMNRNQSQNNDWLNLLPLFLHPISGFTKTSVTLHLLKVASENSVSSLCSTSSDEILHAMHIFDIFALTTMCLNLGHSLDVCNSTKLRVDDIKDYKFDTTVSTNCSCTTNCIRRCCAYDFYYKNDHCLRYNGTKNMSITVYHHESAEGNVTKESSFAVGGGSACDKVPLDPGVNPEEMFYIQSNGSLWIPESGRMLTSEEYCISFGEKRIAFVCSTSSEYWHGWIINAGMLMSIPFLLAILIVYACLPERNTHMKIVMTYILMFFVQWCLQAYDRFTEVIEFKGCRRLGFFSLTFNIGSIYWMNIVCLDMWLSFRTVEGMLRAKENDKRFYYYCAYGHGLTLLHMIVVYAVDASYRGTWYSPNMGNGLCNLRWPWAQFFYYYLSVTIIIFVNTVFFILTTIHIWKIKKGTRNFKHSTSTKESADRNEQFRLFVKLFLVMGINWSLDIVTFYIEWLWKIVPKEVFYIVDFSNAIYGVILFFILVVKKSIWKSLSERHHSVKKIMQNNFNMDQHTKTLSTVATDFEHEMVSEHTKDHWKQ